MTGIELKLWLVGKQISQKQLADFIGVTPKSVNNWTKTKPPLWVKFVIHYIESNGIN